MTDFEWLVIALLGSTNVLALWAIYILHRRFP